MTDLKIILISIFLFFISSTGISQTVRTVDSLANVEQKCLDKGDYMLGCAQTFYFQMDSLLNVVYVTLLSNLDSTHKLELKTQQIQWLKKRDIYFKKTLARNDISGHGQDERMFMYEDDAEFVKKRVLVLIKNLKY